MKDWTRIEITHPLLVAVGSVAEKSNVKAFVVGGYVRDQLLGRDSRDLDVVILGDGIEFAKRFAKFLGKGNVVTYDRFGTAMLNFNCSPETSRPNGSSSDGGTEKIEFVTARKESYSKDSRKPDVEVGTLEDDLSRRDFTINAIAASVTEDGRGELIDPFSGREDLEKGLVRTPLDPEKTFDDDPLRLLRAIRFASQLGFAIEMKVLAAISRRKERLSIVSQERITDEFMKILGSPTPSVGLKLMYDTGVMRIVFPEIADMSGVEQRDEHHHKDVFLHTLKVVDNIAEMSGNLWLRFVALVHDIAKPRTKAFREGIGWTFHGHDEIGARMMKGVFQRMRLPFDHLDYVEKLVRLHLRPMAVVDQTVTDSAVRRLLFDSGEEVDDLLMLCRADITSKNPQLVQQFMRNYEIVSKKMNEVEEKDRLRAFQPPVRGDEIMSVCNLEPGPLVGKLKKMIEEAILDGIIPNEHDPALEYLLKMKGEVLDGQQ
ncbi:MAG: CCA tRNA nucleotidyltransferase [Bacteroidota bacterium]